MVSTFFQDFSFLVTTGFPFFVGLFLTLQCGKKRHVEPGGSYRDDGVYVSQKSTKSVKSTKSAKSGKLAKPTKSPTAERIRKDMSNRGSVRKREKPPPPPADADPSSSRRNRVRRDADPTQDSARSEKKKGGISQRLAEQKIVKSVKSVKSQKSDKSNKSQKSTRSDKSGSSKKNKSAKGKKVDTSNRSAKGPVKSESGKSSRKAKKSQKSQKKPEGSSRRKIFSLKKPPPAVPLVPAEHTDQTQSPITEQTQQDDQQPEMNINFDKPQKPLGLASLLRAYRSEKEAGFGVEPTQKEAPVRAAQLGAVQQAQAQRVQAAPEDLPQARVEAPLRAPQALSMLKPSETKPKAQKITPKKQALEAKEKPKRKGFFGGIFGGKKEKKKEKTPKKKKTSDSKEASKEKPASKKQKKAKAPKPTKTEQNPKNRKSDEVVKSSSGKRMAAVVA
ncbi:unnamed protein product, partial [Mesorhabditis spiculigera]